MTSVDTAFERLREANPVPSPDLLRDESVDVALLLEAVRHRSTAMKTNETARTRSEMTPSRRRWLVGVSVAALIILAGLALVLLADDPPIADAPEETPPAEGAVDVVEAFASGIVANDPTRARRSAAPAVWDERHGHLLGYWEALGARLEITECALMPAAGGEVRCAATMNGGPYPRDLQARQTFTVEGGRVVSPLEYQNEIDLGLYDYAVSVDRSGAETACAVTPDETEAVLAAANGLVYNASCGAFLVDHIDGWLVDSFEHFQVQEPAGAVRVDGFHTPIYARHVDVGEWAIVFFYRPPECIPDDFNLMDFFHPAQGGDDGAVACGPPTVDGYQLWSQDPGPGARLISDELVGDEVPVWVFRSSMFTQAIWDAELTIIELEAIDHRTGVATDFHEVTLADLSGGSLSMGGTLADGTSFTALQKGQGGEVELAYIRVD